MHRIYLSKDNKVILGVCGGISEAFNISANLVRFLFFLSFFLGSLGFWVYLVLAIILPKDRLEVIEVKTEESVRRFCRPWVGRMIGGVCQATANFTNLDVTIVRLIFIGLFLTSGIGLVLYIVGWIFIPNE